jgi:hypothetical protein
MQQWLFVSPSGQQFTVNEPDVASLVQSGQISAQTLMWKEGMAQWMPAASVFPSVFSASAATQPLVAARASGAGVEPATATAAPAAAAPTGRAAGAGGMAIGDMMVRRLAQPLYERKGWIKLVGVMSIIMGVFTLPAFLLGLLLIFAGVALMRLAGSVERAHAAADVASLEQAQRDAGKYFLMQGIFMGIYLALTVLVVALAVLGAGASIFTGLKGLEQQQGVEPSANERFEGIRFPDSPPPAENH